MIDLIFEKVTIAHFRSFATPQTLVLDREAGLWFMRGRNLVEPALGSNGAGKSTVWDAVTWCLYGRTPAGLKNPDIKPWSGKGTPEVELVVTKGEKQYTLRRKAVTNGFWVNGKEAGFEQGAIILGLSFSVFVNTVLFAQGQPLFFDHPAKDKMALLAEVLEFERWEERSKRAAASVRELETVGAEIDGEILGLESAVAQATDLLVRTKNAAQEWETTKRQRAATVAAEIEELEVLLRKHDKRWADAELAYDGAGTELKALRAKLPQLNVELRVAQQEQDKLELVRSTKARQLRELEEQFAELGELTNCPTCDRPLKGTSLERHQTALRTQIHTLRKEVEQSIPTVIVARCAAAVEALDQIERDIAAEAHKEAQARTTLDYLKPAMAEAQATIVQLKRNLAAEQEQRNPHTEQIQVLRRKLAQSTAALEEAKADAVKVQQRTVHMKFWVQGFRDVQLYALEEVLGDLALATSNALAGLGLADWQIDYVVEKEAKNGNIQRGLAVIVRSPRNKNAVRWESWSGGEGQRLRLAGALALSEVLLAYAGIAPNLEVLDEPTRHLSKEGVADLCELLAERAGALGRASWLVDHLAREGQNFAGYVTVVHDAEGSRFTVIRQ